MTTKLLSPFFTPNCKLTLPVESAIQNILWENFEESNISKLRFVCKQKLTEGAMEWTIAFDRQQKYLAVHLVPSINFKFRKEHLNIVLLPIFQNSKWIKLKLWAVKIDQVQMTCTQWKSKSSLSCTAFYYYLPTSVLTVWSNLNGLKKFIEKFWSLTRLTYQVVFSKADKVTQEKDLFFDSVGREIWKIFQEFMN